MTGATAALDAATLRLEAQAKVNLALAVTGTRPDGYHELRSVFLRLELADTLTLAGPAAPDAEPGAAPDELVIEGDPECPVADNLVLRATEGFRRLASDAGVAVPAIRLQLTKRIPMAAGLAGGSSDAAATLRLLAARHPDAASRAELRRLAARLGADVPFFLDGAGAALVTGIGETLEPLPPPIDPVGILLLTPPEGSSTPAVFRAWDESAGASAKVHRRERGSRPAGGDAASRGRCHDPRGTRLRPPLRQRPVAAGNDGHAAAWSRSGTPWSACWAGPSC